MATLVRLRWRTRKYKGIVTKVREAVYNNPETGDRVAKVVNPIPNMREAEREIVADLTEKLRAGVQSFGKPVPMSVVVDKWLLDGEERNRRVKRGAVVGRRHKTARFPKWLLSMKETEIDCDVAQRMVNELQDAGLAADTVRCTYDELKSVLNFCVKQKWSGLKRNVLRDVRGGVELPPKEDKEFINEDDLTAIRTAASIWDERVELLVFLNLRAYVWTSSTTGAGPSEVFSIQCEDVDRAKRVFWVRHSQTFHDGFCKDRPKTKFRKRELPMDRYVERCFDDIERFFQAERTLLAEGHIRGGSNRWDWCRRIRERFFDLQNTEPEFRKSGHLILSKHRKPLHANNVAIPWRGLMKRAGMLDENERNRYTPYDLRHYGLSNLIRTGKISIKETMRLAGHGQSRTTFDVYGKCFANDSQAREAALMIEGKVEESGVPNPCQRLLKR